MKDTIVKDVMIDLKAYATVSETDTLSAAVSAIKKCRNNPEYGCNHRSVLVHDGHGRITGRLSMFDILRALEPGYGGREHPDRLCGGIGLSRFGFSYEFFNSMAGGVCPWDETLDSLVKKAAKRPVKDIMYSPSRAGYVSQNAAVAEAVHQFTRGSHRSLLVLKNRAVVGVLRLDDVFNLIGAA